MFLCVGVWQCYFSCGVCRCISMAVRMMAMLSSPGNPAMHSVVIVMPMSISDFNTVIVYSFG